MTEDQWKGYRNSIPKDKGLGVFLQDNMELLNGIPVDIIEHIWYYCERETLSNYEIFTQLKD